MKTQLLISATIFLGLTFYSSAQITFQKAYGGAGDEYASYGIQTSEGGYLFSGYTSSFGSGYNYLIKTDAYGNTAWTKHFGGVMDEATGRVLQTSDGGYLVSGSTANFTSANYKAYLMKMNSAGVTQWTKIYKSNIAGSYVSGLVNKTSDGGYIMTGYIRAGAIDGISLIKTNANGDTVWTRAYGGGGAEEGRDVHQTTDGGYIIAGNTNSFGAGGSDMYLIKTDANGDTIWTKTYGGPEAEQCTSVKQTNDGGYLIVGGTNSFGAGSGDVYVVKTNSGGDTLWSKTYGGTNSDGGGDIHQTLDGNYIIVGTTYSFSGSTFSNAYLLKINPVGEILWTKTIGEINCREGGFIIQPTSDSGYLLFGEREGSGGAGGIDLLAIKTDSTGSSGCNEGTTATIVSSPPTVVTSPATQLLSIKLFIASATPSTGSGGTVTTRCFAVGVSETVTEREITISPNPIRKGDDFTISLNGQSFATNSQLAIYNALGENVYSSKLQTGDQTLNPNLPTGIYFLKLREGGKLFTSKLIIQ